MSVRITRGALCAVLLVACGEPSRARVCSVPGTLVPDSVEKIGCERDYEAPGYEDDPFSTFAHTRSVNVIIDRQDGDRTYSLNTADCWLHFDFVYFVLEGHPPVPPSDPDYIAAHQQFNLQAYH